MISQLQGEVLEGSPTHIVLGVRGVGYSVAVRDGGAFTEGQTVRLFTHLAVRETALDLYGFLSREECDIFELLLRLPKIGPKSAMQILSQADIELLKKAVIQNDPTYPSKMSGIGAKSAEKIVLGLKDIFDTSGVELLPGVSGEDGDVVDALVSLGYHQKDARDALRLVPDDITDTGARIKEALKLMNT